MNHWKKTLLIAALVLAALLIVGILILRVYAFYHVMDRGMEWGMEGTKPVEGETPEIREVSEMTELVEFSWRSFAIGTNNFQFHIVCTGQEPSGPRLYCDYVDQETGEQIEIGDEHNSRACPTVPSARWEDLADFLRKTQLPPFSPPDTARLAADGIIADVSVSEIKTIWREDGEVFTNSYDGHDAGELLELLQDIAKEANSQPQPALAGGWKCSCGVMNEGQFCTGCGKPQSGDSMAGSHMVDGDGMVAYNAALFHTVEGTWHSEDGRFELTITGRINEAQMTLSLDGETAGECGMNFALLYLDRYPNPETELLKARGTLGISGMSMSLASKPVSELTSEELAELIRKRKSGPLPLTLPRPDGTSGEGTLVSLCHRQQTAEDSGTLHLTIRYEDETEETLTLTKP